MVEEPIEKLDTPVENINKPAPANPILKTSTPKSSVIKGTLGALATPMLSLDSITEEVKEQEAAEKNVVKKELNLENLKEAWASYCKKVESNSVRTTLEDTDLSIVDGSIVSKVGSKVAAGHLREESNLMQYLRTFFGDPGLKRFIEIDKEKMEHVNQNVKILSSKEIFEKFCEKNSLLADFTKDLDLYPD
jgi:hypothetical protein